jgi:hypothetical protein
MKQYDSLWALLNRIQRNALIVGVVGIVLLIVGAFINPTQFFQAYLKGYVFWTQVALGCLGILLIHHVAGGSWSAVIQRPLEAGALTLPLMALLLIPIIFGMQTVYEWARPEVVAEDSTLQVKSHYLNVPMFIGRTVLYIVIWIGLAYLLNRIARSHDETGDPATFARLKAISAPGIIFFFLAATFASFDWMMSLEPHWFSSAYGAIFTVGAGAAAFAFLILLMNALIKHTPLSEIVNIQNINDLGNFQLATVMLWAYVSFSQFLVIWSGNLAEETPWYLTRISNGWQFVAWGMLAFHFVLPFFLLLSRPLKRNPSQLSIVAFIVLVIARPLELLFQMGPAFHPEGLFISWLDVVAPLGIGGLWLAFFVWHLKRSPSAAPLNDPRLHKVKEHLDYGGQHTPSHAH